MRGEGADSRSVVLGGPARFPGSLVGIGGLWLNGVHPGQHLTPSLVSPIYFPPLFSFLFPSPLSLLLYPPPSPHYRLWGAPWSLFLRRPPPQ